MLLKKRILSAIASLSFVLPFFVGSVGASVETGCSKTCSTEEERSCTDSYTACINEAAASADMNKCSACVDTYCSCYDSCGNTCDRGSLGSACTR